VHALLHASEAEEPAAAPPATAPEKKKKADDEPQTTRPGTCRGKAKKGTYDAELEAKREVMPLRVVPYPFPSSSSSSSSKTALQRSTIFFDYPSKILGEEVRDKRRELARLVGEQGEPRPKVRFKISSKVWEYNCLVHALQRSGFQRTPTTRLANVFWSNFLTAEQYAKLNRYQKVNHFPGSYGLGRKDLLVKNITKLRRHHGSRTDFDFLPETFILPTEWSLFKRRADGQPGQMWIIKPTNQSCGKGIKVCLKSSDVKRNRQCVVSKYIMHPYLINGRKFDMRIYVLVSCFDPLRVYLYNDGLVRFATKKYTNKARSAKQRFVHLTNYSVNKHSKNFVKNTDAEEDGTGSKWSVRALRNHLSEQGVDDEKIWEEIEGVVIKTLLSIEADVINRQKTFGNTRNNYFEVMGFDVLLDAGLKPWLLEVNCSPSLSSSSPLDKRIKTQMMSDALHCCGVPCVDIKKATERTSRRNRKLGRVAAVASSHGPRVRAPLASEIQKFRGCNLLDAVSSLSAHDIEVIRETHLEQSRRGNFKAIYPNPRNCRRYSHLFTCPRYNNVLILKYMALSRKQQHSLLHYTPSPRTSRPLVRHSSSSILTRSHYRRSAFLAAAAAGRRERGSPSSTFAAKGGHKRSHKRTSSTKLPKECHVQSRRGLRRLPITSLPRCATTAVDASAERGGVGLRTAALSGHGSSHSHSSHSHSSRIGFREDTTTTARAFLGGRESGKRKLSGSSDSGGSGRGGGGSFRGVVRIPMVKDSGASAVDRPPSQAALASNSRKIEAKSTSTSVTTERSAGVSSGAAPAPSDTISTIRPSLPNRLCSAVVVSPIRRMNSTTNNSHSLETGAATVRPRTSAEGSETIREPVRSMSPPPETSLRLSKQPGSSRHPATAERLLAVTRSPRIVHVPGASAGERGGESVLNHLSGRRGAWTHKNGNLSYRKLTARQALKRHSSSLEGKTSKNVDVRPKTAVQE